MSLHQELAILLTNSEKVIIFTGAGMSTDSGIPDFRSPGGKWSKVTPVMFNDFMNNYDSRFEYWRQKSEGFAEFGDASPTQDIGYWQTGNKTASSTESLHRTSTASTKTPVANWLSKSMVLPEKSSVCIVISETQLTNTVRPFWNHRRSHPALRVKRDF